MLLCSLRDPPNLNQLNIEAAFPRPNPYRPAALYAALKSSSAYDAEGGLWAVEAELLATLSPTLVAPAAPLPLMRGW